MSDTRDFPVPTGDPVPGWSPAATLRTGLRTRDVVAAALTGVAAFAGAYVVAVLSLVVTTLLAGSSSSGSSVGSASGGAPSFGDVVSLWSIIVGAPAQLVLLADLGRLRISGSIDFFTTISGSAHVGFAPALVAAAQIVVLVLGARLFRDRRMPRRQILLTSGISGLALAVTTVILGFALAIRIPRENGVDVHAITGVTLLAIVIALLVGFVATAVARPDMIAALHPLVRPALGTLRVASMHLGGVVAVSGIAVVVYASVTTPTGGAAYPLALGNIAVVVAALGFLGGVSVSESASSLASSATDSAGAGGTATVFAHTSAWLWLAVLLVVVASLAAGFALSIRRGPVVRTTRDWAFTVGAYALGGVVILVLGTIVFSVQVAGLGGSGSVGVTPWTVAVLAGWGVAVEAVAHYAAPRILPSISPVVVARVARFVGSDQGSDVPAAAAAGQDGAGASPLEPVASLPLSPRARRILVRSVIGGGVVVVLVIAGAVTAGALRSGPFGPTTAARAYLTALADGDATTAQRLSGTHATGDMMTDAVFKNASGRIADIAIGRVTTTGDVASVSYRYRQGGSRHDGVLALHRTGTSLLVEDHWRPTPVTGTAVVEVSSALGDADVTSGGHTVGTAKDGELRLSAYPGTYRISVAGSKYFAGGTKTVTISPDSLDADDVRFDTLPTDALTKDATTKVTDLIASCAKTTSGDVPSDCPFYGVSDESQVSYRVTKEPTLSVDVDDDGQVSVTSDKGDGSVHISYVDSFLGESYPQEYDEEFSVYEDLAVQDGTLVFSN